MLRSFNAPCLTFFIIVSIVASIELVSGGLVGDLKFKRFGRTLAKNGGRRFLLNKIVIGLEKWESRPEYRSKLPNELVLVKKLDPRGCQIGELELTTHRIDGYATDVKQSPAYDYLAYFEKLQLNYCAQKKGPSGGSLNIDDSAADFRWHDWLSVNLKKVMHNGEPETPIEELDQVGKLRRLISLFSKHMKPAHIAQLEELRRIISGKCGKSIELDLSQPETRACFVKGIAVFFTEEAESAQLKIWGNIWAKSKPNDELEIHVHDEYAKLIGQVCHKVVEYLAEPMRIYKSFDNQSKLLLENDVINSQLLNHGFTCETINANHIDIYPEVKAYFKELATRYALAKNRPYFIV